MSVTGLRKLKNTVTSIETLVPLSSEYDVAQTMLNNFGLTVKTPDFPDGVKTSCVCFVYGNNFGGENTQYFALNGSLIEYAPVYELFAENNWVIDVVSTDNSAVDEWILANTDPAEDKDFLIKESMLKEIADAIRSKNGTSEAIATENMASAIKIPLPQKVATESGMTSLLETAEVGSVYMYVGESGTYENGAIYIVEEETQ